MGIICFLIIVGVLIYEAMKRNEATKYANAMRKLEGKPPFDWKKYE